MPAYNKSKYLAIGTFAEGATLAQLNPSTSSEVHATLKMPLDGKMDQFWLRDDGEGVVLVMNAESAEEAETLLDALPLAKAGHLQFDLIPIGLIPIGTLTPFQILLGSNFSVGE